MDSPVFSAGSGRSCSSDAWDIDQPYSLGSPFDARNQGPCHLLQSDKPKAPSPVPRLWQQGEDGIKGEEQVGPGMAGTKYIPGAQDSCSDPTGADVRLAGLTRGNIRSHNGSGLSDADVDKMPDPRVQRGG